MNEYNHGCLYIGNIKINNQTLREKAILIYDKQKDVFYGIEVLNELIDLESNKTLTPETKIKIKKIVNNSTFPHYIERNDNITYIEESTITEFSPEKPKYNSK